MTSCEIDLLGDGLVRVRWRSLVSFPAGAKHVAFKLFADRVRDLQCEGSAVKRPTVVQLGRRAAVLLELDGEGSPRLGTARQSQVELIYTCRASHQRWTPNIGVWCLTREVLPRLYFGPYKRAPRWLAHSEATPGPETGTTTQILLSWNAESVTAFGPIADPASGVADLLLSESELADFEVYFGTFTLGARRDGVALWAPLSNALSSSESGYHRVITYAARVRDYLAAVFGKPKIPVQHIVLAPGVAGPARLFGSTVLIRDPRDGAGEISAANEADVLSQLAHELSHASWVPVVIDDADRRVWGLIEGIAVACEFLTLTHLLSNDSQRQFMPRRKARHCDLVTRRFEELFRQYRSREASAGLRFGYVLTALIVSQRRPTLGSLRRLLHSFSANAAEQVGIAVRLAEAFGQELGNGLLEVLDRPRPPVVSVRVKGEQKGGEVWLRFGTDEDATGFLRLLHGSKAFADKLREVTQRRQAVRLKLKPLASGAWVEHLTPGFVVDRRVIQWNRVEDSRVLRVLSEVAWRQRARSGHQSIVGCLYSALVGLAEMIVESESALGYELVADALEGWMTPVARRLRKAASSRAPW